MSMRSFKAVVIFSLSHFFERFDLISSGLRFWNVRHINTLRKHKEIEIGAHFHSMLHCVGSASAPHLPNISDVDVGTLSIRQDISTLHKY